MMVSHYLQKNSHGRLSAAKGVLYLATYTSYASTSNVVLVVSEVRNIESSSDICPAAHHACFYCALSGI